MAYCTHRMGDREESNVDGGRARRSPDSGYRWECPICEKSRVNLLSMQGRNALRALKTHVYLSDGDGHGDVGSYPDGIPEERLRLHVCPAGDVVD